MNEISITAFPKWVTQICEWKQNENAPGMRFWQEWVTQYDGYGMSNSPEYHFTIKVLRERNNSLFCMWCEVVTGTLVLSIWKELLTCIKDSKWVTHKHYDLYQSWLNWKFSHSSNHRYSTINVYLVFLKCWCPFCTWWVLSCNMIL